MSVQWWKNHPVYMNQCMFSIVPALRHCRNSASNNNIILCCVHIIIQYIVIVTYYIPTNIEMFIIRHIVRKIIQGLIGSVKIIIYCICLYYLIHVYPLYRIVDLKLMWTKGYIEYIIEMANEKWFRSRGSIRGFICISDACEFHQNFILIFLHFIKNY